MRSDLIDLAVILKAETQKAWLVLGDTEEAWVPKSQAEVSDPGPDGVRELTLPEWLAIEKGLV